MYEIIFAVDLHAAIAVLAYAWGGYYSAVVFIASVVGDLWLGHLKYLLSLLFLSLQTVSDPLLEKNNL